MWPEFRITQLVEEVNTPETSVLFYQITRHSILQDCLLRMKHSIILSYNASIVCTQSVTAKATLVHQ